MPDDGDGVHRDRDTTVALRPLVVRRDALGRACRLPEAWIAPPVVRGLRDAIRHRSKLVSLRSGLKAQVHAVLAKQGVRVPMSGLFGVGGQRLLDELQLDAPYNARFASLRRLVDALTFEIDILTKRNSTQLKPHPGFRAIQTMRADSQSISDIGEHGQPDHQ